MAERADDALPGSPTSLELAEVAGAAPPRQADFLIGRSLARAALVAHGVHVAEIPVGPDREPVWPAGVVGSITHASGHRAAVVAPRRELALLGIDVEAARPLPPEVLPVAFTSDELRVPGCWPLHATVAFSMKESVYKAVFQATRVALDLHDASVTLGADGTATVDILATSVPDEIRVLRGRWTAAPEHVLTAIAVPTRLRRDDDRRPSRTGPRADPR